MKAFLTTLLLASTTLLTPSAARADELDQPTWNKLNQIFTQSEVVVASVDGTDADRANLPPEAKILENAAACSTAAKDALAHNADADTEFLFTDVIAGKVKTTKYVLADVDTKLCQVAATKAKGLDERRAKAAAAAKEAKLGPYKKLGVTGDKLEMVDKYTDELLGPRQAQPTPQIVAKSSVLFRLIKEDDWNYTLQRYQFSGNRRVKVTTQTFHRAPPPSEYR